MTKIKVSFQTLTIILLNELEKCFLRELNHIISVKLIAGALPGMIQWIEYQLVNQRVAGSIPIQGTCLGCKPGRQ